MPTSRKRHSITETPRVEAALDELRRATPGERVDLGELVILGARSKLDQLRDADERQAQLLDDLAERVLAGDVSRSFSRPNRSSPVAATIGCRRSIS